MNERVVVTLDVTMDEAREIAERIAGVGPFYEGWSLPVALDEVAELDPCDGKLRRVYLRSNDSAKLGGPDVD